MNPMGSYLWSPSDPDAAAIEQTFRNWTAFYVAHRSIFLGHASLHLRRPTSRAYEATAFFLNSADAQVAGTLERGLVVLFNPSLHVERASLDVPLYYAGFAPGDTVAVSRVFPGSAPPLWLANLTLGMSGAAAAYDVSIDVLLPPRSYATLSILPAASSTELLVGARSFI
jgi:hypothetical protein